MSKLRKLELGIAFAIGIAIALIAGGAFFGGGKASPKFHDQAAFEKSVSAEVGEPVNCKKSDELSASCLGEASQIVYKVKCKFADKTGGHDCTISKR